MTKTPTVFERCHEFYLLVIVFQLKRVDTADDTVCHIYICVDCMQPVDDNIMIRLGSAQ